LRSGWPTTNDDQPPIIVLLGRLQLTRPTGVIQLSSARVPW
jgi:hypothetical protein